MFEEGAWSDGEGAPPPAARPPLPPPPPARRRRLLATLRRLEAASAAAIPPSASSPRGERSAAAEAEPEGGAGAERRLSRRQWRNRQKNQRRRKNKFRPGQRPPAPRSPSPPPPGAPSPPSPPSPPVRRRLEQRLDSARFRYLNQQLYSRPSRQAARLFQQDPEAFAAYHRGFAQQLARWPDRPLQRFVRYLRRRPASLVVADFGCGDCTLARSIPNRVHCFDVAALDPRVTICDMAQVPLEDASVDVAVFCLALMGTNLCEILEEANRVLRVGGVLLVAEVASRFEDLHGFLGSLASLGFQLVSKDVSGSHFYTLELRKEGPPHTSGAGPTKTPAGLVLRPCVYKRR
ncbi:ribosomal RNA-processing protein 8 [Sphaerodactylus townsendi]|uniref:25S rRNA (Adenine645-N1)-methyltransferase n=1 Tax=Sphaerodactylus townsendi TaxID=933632 RepID=A0ACB8FG17_9SAUR|nr:ribosomal RNA-processing protein 8 [Sphaerodactylus townsendi]